MTKEMEISRPAEIGLSLLSTHKSADSPNVSLHGELRYPQDGALDPNLMHNRQTLYTPPHTKRVLTSPIWRYGVPFPAFEFPFEPAPDGSDALPLESL
jgi:hypothetical protein